MPFSRFLICDFSSWQLTTVLVGRCVIRTAEYVVFTLCPPGPDEQNVSMRRSLGSILMSTSSASGSTATVIADVCTRPCVSVAGTRCTRCTPDSYFSCEYTLLPSMIAVTSFNPCPIRSEEHTPELQSLTHLLCRLLLE